MHTCIHANLQTNIYTYMHTYIHTHIHTYTYLLVLLQVVQLLACAEGSGTSSASRSIHSSVEDFMWFKLCAVLSPGAPLTVSDVAAKIEAAGPDHFNARANPYLYTRLLLLCQRFERAVAFLAGRGFRAYTDAVHLAIALNAFGLLRTGSRGRL
jgi:hypothetical protein